jgi:hypothetical protein
MVHQVLANGVMPAGKKRYLELCPDTVRRADENGLFPATQLKGSPEAADSGEYITAESTFCEVLDAGNSAIGFVDRHTGIAVTNALVGRHAGQESL